MDIPSIAAVVPPRAVEPSATGQVPVGRAPATTEAPLRRPALDPAVRVDLAGVTRGAAAQDVHPRIAVEPTSRELLFQVVEGETGTVVVQVPDERTVRAHIYAREAAALADREAHAPLAIA